MRFYTASFAGSLRHDPKRGAKVARVNARIGIRACALAVGFARLLVAKAPGRLYLPSRLDLQRSIWRLCHRSLLSLGRRVSEGCASDLGSALCRFWSWPRSWWQPGALDREWRPSRRARVGARAKSARPGVTDRSASHPTTARTPRPTQGAGRRGRRMVNANRVKSRRQPPQHLCESIASQPPAMFRLSPPVVESPARTSDPTSGQGAEQAHSGKRYRSHTRERASRWQTSQHHMSLQFIPQSGKAGRRSSIEAWRWRIPILGGCGASTVAVMQKVILRASG